MTALTLLAKWTASSPSWKNMLMICFATWTFSPCLNLGVTSGQRARTSVYARPTTQMWPAGQLQLVPRNTVWFATIQCQKEPGGRLCVFWGCLKQQSEWQVCQSARCICSQYSSNGLKLGTHWQDHLGGVGCLEQGWGLVLSESVNYCGSTGVCLPKLQRTDDTCVGAASLPRLGLSKDWGRRYQTEALLAQRPWPLFQHQVSIQGQWAERLHQVVG